MKYIRYTKGPDDLSLGDCGLKRADLDEESKGWVKVRNEIVKEAMHPDRVEEYGFESAKTVVDGEVTEPDLPTDSEGGGATAESGDSET